MKNSAYLLLSASLLLSVCQGQETQLRIDRSTGISRINLQGETNRDYTLVATEVSSTNWDFLATLTLTNPSASWFDSASGAMPNRFYRAIKLETPVLPEYVDDFRLIDQQGKSRSLYYFQNDPGTKAIVLIFTGNGCSNVQQFVSTINSLTNFNPQGIVTWMIDANAADNRSNILAEATALGIKLPILHDRAQIVAHAFHANSTPEVVCINKSTWTIFYRGAIDDRMGPSPIATTQYYLTNALSDFLASRTISPRATRPHGCAITLNPLSEPSYSTDIAPLLLNKCVRCHSPGNFAPFSMTNYTSVQGSQAKKMRLEVLAGRMPPWQADYHYGTFTNDFSLTPAEAAMLVQWVDNGGPRGSGPDPLTNAPPPPDYPFAWPTSLGPPAASNIISIGTQSIPATGTIDYRYVNYTYTGPTVWLRAAVILPGTVPVVHHILVYQKGVDNTVQSFLTGYAPGSFLGAFPPGTAKLLTNGTPLQFQLHYVAMGDPTNDISYLGLYTTPTAPDHVLVQTSAASASFAVPPNTTDYQSVTESAATTTKIRLYEFSPHLHTRGARFKYEAIYPAGSNPASEVLISVPNYVFHWQTAYRLAEPKDLPVGTKLRCTAGWDNSVQNYELMQLFTDPDNPNNMNYNPNNTVTWGDQTWNEMFIGYYNYSVIP